MFAIVEIAGKQFKVKQGDVLEVPRLKENKEGDKVKTDSVLLRSDGKKTDIGMPKVTGAQVELLIKEHGKAAKVRIFKKKSKKRYERTQGHRQPYSLVEVVGVPLPDMGTSEHCYGALMKALFARAMTGKGSRIDASMFESTTSWLTVPITMSRSFGKYITRRGNTHEFFAPVSVYPTSDGYVYIAVGNDKQFKALSELSEFAAVAKEEYAKNLGRIRDVENLNDAVSEATAKMTTGRLLELMRSIGVAASKINSIEDVAADPLVAPKLIKARDDKTGFELTLAPPPFETSFLKENRNTLSFPPRFGEHNEAILGKELGFSADQIAALKADGII